MELFDAEQGNLEHRFLADGFHFGTLIEDAPGRLIFRPHPDRGAPDGFGTSWYMNPFLAGADPGFGAVDGVAVTDSGISIALSGEVARGEEATYGTWDLDGMIGYDAASQRIGGAGVLSIALDDTLAAVGADLNLDRLSSNFLHDVPVQRGATGDTGDMEHVLVRYASEDDPRNFTWDPPSIPSHFPFDFAADLEVEVVGQLNTVDTLGLGEGFQIKVVRKPSITLSYSSASDEMIIGLVWDRVEGKNFAADNISVNHLFVQGRTSATDFVLSFHFESEVISAGDANCDGVVAAADLVQLIRLLGAGDRAPCGFDDLNGDDINDEGDIALLLTLLMSS